VERKERDDDGEQANEEGCGGDSVESRVETDVDE